MSISTARQSVAPISKRRATGLGRPAAHERTNIQIEAVITELRRFQSSRDAPKERIKVSGATSYLRKDERIVDAVIISFVNKLEPLALRLPCDIAAKQGIQTLSVMCQGGKPLQELLHEKRAMDILARLLSETDTEIGQWAAHCMFILAVKSFDKYMAPLLSPRVMQRLEVLSGLDWSEWPTNNAAELKDLIKLLSKHQ
nr:hypothetical protein HK105_006655 [Polyrhizophydium stewartii]